MSLHGIRSDFMDTLNSSFEALRKANSPWGFIKAGDNKGLCFPVFPSQKEAAERCFNNNVPEKERKMRGTTVKNHIENLLTRMRLCEVHLQEAENRMRKLECGVEGMKTLREMSGTGRKGFSDSLESRIDALEYPMGRMEKRFGWCESWVYVYANKDCIISDISRNNITAFRKKGDYVEIKWVEEIEVPEHILVPNGNLTEKQKEEFISNNGMFVNVNETDGIVKIRAGKQKITKTRTFLLKDTLIPLDAVYDFGDTEWKEVSK